MKFKELMYQLNKLNDFAKSKGVDLDEVRIGIANHSLEEVQKNKFIIRNESLPNRLLSMTSNVLIVNPKEYIISLHFETFKNPNCNTVTTEIINENDDEKIITLLRESWIKEERTKAKYNISDKEETRVFL